MGARATIGQVDATDDRPRYRLVSPSGSPVTGTVEQMLGVGGIAGIEVTPDGSWDVEYNGCSDVIWDTESPPMRDQTYLTLVRMTAAPSWGRTGIPTRRTTSS